MNEIEGLEFMLTLTYPGNVSPTSSKTMDYHWELLCRWMRKHVSTDVYGVRVREWGKKNGRPHIHALVSGGLVKSEVAVEWLRIIGAENNPANLRYSVSLKPISNLTGIITYLTKRKPQQVVPPGFDHSGRFWSEFGTVKKLPTELILGPRDQIAPLLRVLRKLESQARRAHGLRVKGDKGGYGFTIWNADARTAFVRNLPRLRILFGLNAVTNVSGGVNSVCSCLWDSAK
jgi:hypothetical protein